MKPPPLYQPKALRAKAPPIPPVTKGPPIQGPPTQPPKPPRPVPPPQAKTPYVVPPRQLPRAPAPFYRPNSMPLDPLYEQQVSNARLGYQNTTADLAQQESQLRTSYGFDDPSDVFNRASMLQRAYKQGQTQTLGSYASGGQLYSGALQSGLDEGTHGYQQQYHGLRQQYTADLDKVRRARLQAAQGFREAQTAAYGDRLSRALQQRPEDPGTPPPPPRPKPKRRPKRHHRRRARVLPDTTRPKGARPKAGGRK